MRYLAISDRTYSFLDKFFKFTPLGILLFSIVLAAYVFLGDNVNGFIMWMGLYCPIVGLWCGCAILASALLGPEYLEKGGD